MIEKVEGFILSETPFSDSSKIINVYTKEHGVIGIMCKGAKSLKSKNRATTLKFTYGYFNIYYKNDKLSTLIDVEVINSLMNTRNDIELICYINYITELTNQVLKTGDDELLYSLFINTILKIENKFNPIVIMNIYEVKLLDYLGVQLNLNSCNTCGSNKNIVTIDGDSGGLVCQNCYQNQPLVNLKVIHMLRNYYYVDIEKISKLDISESLIYDINNFLDLYYDRYTGLYLNSKKFLKEILKK